MSQVEDTVHQFANEVACYAQWARFGTDQGEIAVRNALVHITRLYLAALSLPSLWSDELTSEPQRRVDQEEWQSVFAAAARLPLNYYGEVYDPLLMPPEQPVVGSLADDIADIYRDVVTGLRHYEDSQIVEAVWEWKFHFQYHWGEHATGAIRVLHCWLETNSPFQLGAS